MHTDYCRSYHKPSPAVDGVSCESVRRSRVVSCAWSDGRHSRAQKMRSRGREWPLLPSPLGFRGGIIIDFEQKTTYYLNEGVFFSPSVLTRKVRLAAGVAGGIYPWPPLLIFSNWVLGVHAPMSFSIACRQSVVIPTPVLLCANRQTQVTRNDQMLKINIIVVSKGKRVIRAKGTPII